jgi:CDP-glucose 4,6-dehydratase
MAGRARAVEGVGMRLSFTDAFRHPSVFLTGHTGFKGSWLALWLHRLGARVTGYSLAVPSEPRNFVSSAVGGVLARDYEEGLSGTGAVARKSSRKRAE